MSRLLLAAALCGVSVAVATTTTTTSSSSAAAASDAAAPPKEAAFVEVFTPHEGGYPCIRIPAIVRVPATGRLVAFAECRREIGDGCIPWLAANASSSPSAAKPARDICSKHSNDTGATWSVLAVVASGAMQPVPVWSSVEQAVVLAYNADTATDKRVRQMRSADGLVWGAAELVALAADTAMVGPGSGGGVELWTGQAAGKLAFIGHNGAYTWDSVWVGGRNASGYTECAGCRAALARQDEAVLVQLPSGTLVASTRNKHDTPCRCRGVAYSHDGGHTFTDVADDPVLIDPVCQATMVYLRADGLVAFANPASETSRTHGTLRLGRETHGNGTIAWTAAVPVHSGDYGYSSLVDVERAGQVGLLWETSGPQCVPLTGASCRSVFSLVAFNATAV